MCKRCLDLKTRSIAMAKRIERLEWDVYAARISKEGYQILLKNIETHWNATGHEVDTLGVTLAIGKKVILDR